MSLICSCPVGAAITDITVSSCPESFGQVQKLVFQRQIDATIPATPVVNDMTVAAASLAATWTALTAAVGDTKAQSSPFVENPETEIGAVREFGGGNQTLGGRPVILGSNPTQFTGVINQSPQSTILELKDLMCEKMQVYMINEEGKIGGDEHTTGQFKGFNVYAFWVGDKNLGGFDEPDSNAISFWMPANWSDNFYIATPAAGFNPLEDI